MRRMLTIGAAAIACVVPAATAHGAVDLAGSTILQGSGPGVAQIELDRPATLDNDALRVEGGGSFAGYALVAEGNDLNRVIVSGGVIRAAGAKDQTFVMSATPALPPMAPTFTLPAGRYRLYLLADRAATVRVAVADRSGERSLPMAPAQAELRRPAVRYLSQGYSSSGDHASLGGPGIMLGVLTKIYGAMAMDDTTSCHFEGEEAAASPVAYAPECPTAQSRGKFNIANVDLPGRIGTRTMALAATSIGGVWGQGFATTAVAARESYEHDALWLTFDRSPWQETSTDAVAAPAASAPPVSAPPAPTALPAPAVADPAAKSASLPAEAAARAAAPSLSIRPTSLRTLLRSGLRVDARDVTGTLRLRAVSGGRTLAVGSARARDGRATVVLRLTRTGRRIVRRTRRPLAVRVIGARGLDQRVTLR